MAAWEEEGHKDLGYVIQTLPVKPDCPNKLDTKMSSREKDGVTIKMPSHSNNCPIQLWEVYVVASVLLMQPPSSVLIHHVQALCEHNDPKHLCLTVLKEHTRCGAVTDTSQETTLYNFCEEYLQRKLQIHFPKNGLVKYLSDTLDDPLCGWSRIPRAYFLSVFVQALLLNAQFFEGQYEELVESMKLVNLPVNDLMQEGEITLGESSEIKWDNVKLYDDPMMILKRYGGWAITKTARMLSPKDQLVMRLTGCTLEQLLTGVDVPDSPRGGREGGGSQIVNDELKKRDMDDDSDSNLSDFEIDPDHPKINPLGLSLSETFLLFRGALLAEESKKPSLFACVIGHDVAGRTRDQHMLAAAVLVDLYMREQIDVHHWTIQEGTVAVAYKCERRKGLGKMHHFLDLYSEYAETIFRDMSLPSHIGDEPIWRSLENRGVIDNHRYSYERHWLFRKRIDVWDFIRPDLLLDFKSSYLTSARILYDQGCPDPLDELSNDHLMFCYLVQLLFDHCHESVDGMSRLMKLKCPPFEKGELYPPVAMVHSGAVCVGLIDRGFRVAHGKDCQLAMEAAEFNELIMEKMEQKFFLSPNIWQTFDVDESGELTIDEFVEGMRSIDVYKDFRKERVPDDVLRMIVSDLAERLFQEVDIDGDGTLTPEELQSAFKRRREEAEKERERGQWLRRQVKAVAVQIGVSSGIAEENKAFKDAMEIRDKAVKHSRLKESWRKREWQSELDRVEMPDELVDVNTSSHRQN